MKGSWPVLLFAMTWPTVAALIYFVGLSSGIPGHGPNPWLQSFYGGSKVVQFALPVLWLGLVQRSTLRPQPPSGRGMSEGIVFGLLVAAAMLALYYGVYRGSPLLAQTPREVRTKVEEFGAATPLGFIVLGSFVSIVHSLLEEYYWRWFVFGQLKSLVTLWPSIVISGLAFMAHHVVVLAVYFPDRLFSATLPFGLAVAIGGMFWAWLYQRSGSIWAPYVSHLLVDVAIMVVGYDMLFGSAPYGRG